MVTISGAVGQQGYGILLKLMDEFGDIDTNSATVHNRTGLQYDPVYYRRASYIYPAAYLIAVLLLVLCLSCPKKPDDSKKDTTSILIVKMNGDEGTMRTTMTTST